MTVQLIKKNAASGILQQTPVSSAGVGIKAGTVLKAAFTGSPRTATVTFATPFPDANYAITLGVGVTGSSLFNANWRNKTASGFTITLGTSCSITNLVAVDWHAAPYGE
jgi:hypothetical protein